MYNEQKDLPYTAPENLRRKPKQYMDDDMYNTAMLSQYGDTRVEKKSFFTKVKNKPGRYAILSFIAGFSVMCSQILFSDVTGVFPPLPPMWYPVLFVIPGAMLIVFGIALCTLSIAKTFIGQKDSSGDWHYD